MNEKSFMENPCNWPRHPILPIKRRKPHDFPDCACLVVTSDRGTVFVDAPIPFSQEEVPAFRKALKEASTADLDQLIKDGWVVD